MHPQSISPNCICQACGKSFYLKPSAIAKGRGKFCSRACASVSYKRPKKDPLIRFWSKVQKTDGCWLWTGAKNSWGYGQMSAMHGERIASRVSWVLANGPIPDGQEVCHSCDNPPCVRPDHLFLGTTLENAQDRSRKNRTDRVTEQRGEQHHKARLTNAIVVIIRQQARDGLTHEQIAALHGVSKSTVQGVVSRRNWAHVP
jgi:hypothetical protein